MAKVKGKKCPLCNKSSSVKYHPFCSDRCSKVDLSRWLGGKYAIETEEIPDIEEMQDALKH